MIIVQMYEDAKSRYRSLPAEKTVINKTRKPFDNGKIKRKYYGLWRCVERWSDVPAYTVPNNKLIAMTSRLPSLTKRYFH